MARSATPFLMFQNGEAEEAMTFYVSLFANSRVVSLVRYGETIPGPEGKVMLARFEVAGSAFYCSDSSVKHGFDFTPSLSVFIDCTSAEELDAAFARLLEGGRALMPVGNYGFSQRFGWVQDRFGVSWQLSLP